MVKKVLSKKGENRRRIRTAVSSGLGESAEASGYAFRTHIGVSSSISVAVKAILPVSTLNIPQIFKVREKQVAKIVCLDLIS